MVKLLGWVVLLSVVFGAGYYVGQHPVAELKKTAADFTRTVRDTTLGLERSMRLRQGLVDAKAELIQAKSELLDKNFGKAAGNLARAEEHLAKAEGAEREAGQTPRIKLLADKLDEAKQALAKGKPVARAKLDEIQKELDSLLP